MCGIAGTLSFRSDDLSHASPSDTLVSLMDRRGPDDRGSWTDEQHSAFAFRRLSILDLSPASNQPMLTADGRYVIVYNGEMYNFRILREELEQSGIRFRTSG